MVVISVKINVGVDKVGALQHAAGEDDEQEQWPMSSMGNSCNNDEEKDER